MRSHFTYRARLAMVFCTSAVLFVFVPYFIYARGTEADAQCVPVVIPCPCGFIKDPQTQQCTQPGPNKLGCPCIDTTNGKQSPGTCTAEMKCRYNLSSSNQGGGSTGNLTDLSKLLQQLQSMLKGLGGGGGGSGGGQQGGGLGGMGSGFGGGGFPSQNGLFKNTNPQVGQCETYYTVTTPSSDPCAVYNPAGNSSSPASNLINSLATNSAVDNAAPLTNAVSTGGSSDLLNTVGGNTGGNTTPSTPSANNTPPSTGTDQQNVSPNPFVPGLLALPAGLSGDIRFSDSRVTVLVSNVDAKNGTQVAGFYGVLADGQPQSTIAGMCAARPWKSNFLSYIVPPSFFDSLCTLRGFKVGVEPPPVSSTASTHYTPKPKPTPQARPTPPVATSTEPHVPPKADIWAVPAAVPLGARTTVFWSAKGVTSCTETSPDGSFSQNTLSGGAATVPLSGDTTYTISCITPSGDHITNYVTVHLSTN